MATVYSHVSAPAGISAKLSAFFHSVSVALVAYMERRTRADQIAALQAKSDEELAKMGVNRDEIPAYVFRDLFYV